MQNNYQGGTLENVGVQQHTQGQAIEDLPLHFDRVAVETKALEVGALPVECEDEQAHEDGGGEDGAGRLGIPEYGLDVAFEDGSELGGEGDLPGLSDDGEPCIESFVLSRCMVCLLSYHCSLCLVVVAHQVL